MNWLTRSVLPRISVFGRKRDIPDNLWVKCSNCGQMIFHRDLKQAQWVCPHCDYHMRLSPKQRFDALFDEGRYDMLPAPGAPADPLKFRDSKKYPDRLKEARAKTGAEDSVMAAEGRIGGNPAVIAAQNFAFMGGSMGAAAGEMIIAAAERALATRSAFIAISASGGMRMQEGIISLMQMPRTTVIVHRLREAGLPFIVILTDPTTGGVTASFAMLGDIAIAEPGALIGFAGQRVIEQTIREKLPEGFQRAEYLLEHGMLDMVVHRHELRGKLAACIDLLRVPFRKAEEADETPAEKAADIVETSATASGTGEETAADTTGTEAETPRDD